MKIKMVLIIFIILTLFFACTTDYYFYQYKKEQVVRKALGSKHLQKFTDSLIEKIKQ